MATLIEGWRRNGTARCKQALKDAMQRQALNRALTSAGAHCGREWKSWTWRKDMAVILLPMMEDVSASNPGVDAMDGWKHKHGLRQMVSRDLHG
eukprot:761064-Hanusia_phi.AAC.1